MSAISQIAEIPSQRAHWVGLKPSCRRAQWLCLACCLLSHSGICSHRARLVFLQVRTDSWSSSRTHILSSRSDTSRSPECSEHTASWKQAPCGLSSKTVYSRTRHCSSCRCYLDFGATRLPLSRILPSNQVARLCRSSCKEFKRME